MNVIQGRLVADMKTAMKAKDKLRLQVVRLLIASLKDTQLQSESDEMTEEQELAVLRKSVKMCRDAIEQAEKVGRADIVEQESAELEVIQGYLPAAMSAGQLAEKVAELAAEIGYGGPVEGPVPLPTPSSMRRQNMLSSRPL